VSPSNRTSITASACTFEGYTSVRQLGSILLMNAGVTVTCTGGKPEIHCAGKADGEKVATTPATKDVRVRRAIAAAVDNDVINQRVYGGDGLTTASMFHPTFPFDPEVDGPAFDPDEARRLVDEAKAAGWDGSLSLTCTNSQQHRDLALALTTMLAAVGIQVDAKTDQDTAAQVNDVIVNKNFEAACWGFQVTEDDSHYTALLQGLTSTSPTNRTGYANPTMDAAIDDLRAASAPEAKTDAFRSIAEIYTSDVPVLNFGATPQFVAWSERVNGIVPNSSAVVYFDKAWIEG
jgi:peptide/nickel transport system substrate-binding protein